jgi:antitoxin (DNA-binding transcriptional repressor) of toxin-antitoxin stability system
MLTMTAVQARYGVRKLLDAAIAGQATVITRNGVHVAVVLPASVVTIEADKPAE